MIPDLVRDVAKQLALRFAFRVRRTRMSADEVFTLEAWAMARLASNDYELLRTTKLSDVWMLVERLLHEYLAQPGMSRIAASGEMESGLRVRVKCLDVEVGCATFERPVGLAYTTLEPSDHYSMVAPYAQDIGKWLAVRREHPPEVDVADVVAAQWKGERLYLENLLGQELSVSHVIITESPPAPHNKKTRISLVADFRSDHTRVGAVVPTSDVGGGGRNRPTM